MKNRKVSIKIIGIILTIGIIITLVLIRLNNKNTNIEKQEITSKEQLTQTTSSNAYISMANHLAETKSFTPIEFCAGTKQEISNYTLFENKGYSTLKISGFDVNVGSNTVGIIVSGGITQDNMTELLNKTYTGITTATKFSEPLSVDISSYEYVKVTIGVSNAYGRLVTLNYEVE